MRKKSRIGQSESSLYTSSWPLFISVNSRLDPLSTGPEGSLGPVRAQHEQRSGMVTVAGSAVPPRQPLPRSSMTTLSRTHTSTSTHGALHLNRRPSGLSNCTIKLVYTEAAGVRGASYTRPRPLTASTRPSSSLPWPTDFLQRPPLNQSPLQSTSPALLVESPLAKKSIPRSNLSASCFGGRAVPNEEDDSAHREERRSKLLPLPHHDARGRERE